MAIKREIYDSARVRELKARRKKIFKIKLYIGIFLLVAAFVGLVYLSRSPKINISTINISGNSVVTNEEILNIARSDLAGRFLFLFPKSNIFLFREGKLERDILASFQRISDVSVRRDNFREITITVAERDAKYLWCDKLPDGTDGQCYFADKTGYIFDEAPSFSGNTYFRFYGGFQEPDAKIGEAILPAEEFSRLAGLYEAASLAMDPVKITAVTIADNGEYKFSLDGTAGYIVFKKENDFEKIAENLDSAVTSEPLKGDLKSNLKNLLYIDLRFNDKVYFKFQQ